MITNMPWITSLSRIDVLKIVSDTRSTRISTLMLLHHGWSDGEWLHGSVTGFYACASQLGHPCYGHVTSQGDGDSVGGMDGDIGPCVRVMVWRVSWSWEMLLSAVLSGRNIDIQGDSLFVWFLYLILKGASVTLGGGKLKWRNISPKYFWCVNFVESILWSCLLMLLFDLLVQWMWWED